MESPTTLDIRVVSTADEARAALAEGYEPVECAFGSESVVGPLGLDHHGELSDMPPVCRLAHDLLTGGWWYSAQPGGRWVVRGVPDADASLAIAILADGLPGDDILIERIVSLVAASDVGDWKDLTQEGRAGAIILAWHARQQAPSLRALLASDPVAATHAAVNDWAELLALPREGRELLSGGAAHELTRARDSEAERVAKARSAKITWESDSVALIESPVMGAPIWYADHPGLRGYVAWQRETQRISISLRPGTAQEDYSGACDCPGGIPKHRVPACPRAGLLQLVGDLPHPGWGGRPEIIGSPHGVTMTRDDAVRAAKLLAERIDEVAR